ncbi:PREDICTED: aspartic proteinase nepenthesin-1-like [Camelina sativa]|uniref:Aspartic proteinase nepenthesin-1-like n=1 Tax=Camelina sativa TaxID=90675 RepID=A0ABM0ZD58_CAMSA|nr:PREDICTED: aspartic proteinase nepenthesin-1-like [Camelina sativa]
MVSSSSSSFSLLFPFFLILFSCLISLSSSSRSLIDRPLPKNLPRSGFRLSLQHVDSGKNLTKIQKIQRGINRGFHRLNRLGAVAVLAVASNPDDTNNIKAPTHGGSGEFLMELSIGNPAVKYSAIFDTGSDLIWTQCKPCTECFDQPTPIFDPEKSSSYSKVGCSSGLCNALPRSNCNQDNDACEYLYTYGDYSSTSGFLATETFTFEEGNSIPGIGFGCGVENEGDGFSQGSGLVGLGRGPLSLISELKETKFSYCLTSIGDSEASSSLFIGSLASNIVNKTGASLDGEVTKTMSLLRNPNQPSFYYLELQGITVGGKRLSVEKSNFELTEDGTGGMIIDSGTTITYLEESAFKELKEEFTSRMSLPVDDSGSTGLDLCFKLPNVEKDIAVPKLIFHFKGADLELPGENYMVADSSTGLLCLAMGSSNRMSIFGNVQQQNFNVLHDLEKETVSFVPTECGKL